MEKPAYTIEEIVQLGPLSRSKLYEEIAANRLTARKVGRRTVILAEDFQRYLASLPAVVRARA